MPDTKLKKGDLAQAKEASRSRPVTITLPAYVWDCARGAIEERALAHKHAKPMGHADAESRKAARETLGRAAAEIEKVLDEGA